MPNKKVIVVGGGFGGFKAVKKLLFRGFEVLLISEGEKFVFTPLLVEVSAGTLLPQDIGFRFVDYFKHRNFKFVLGQVTKTDFDSKQVYVGQQAYAYDYLILAPGSRKRDMEIPGFEHGLPLKTIHHALLIKAALISKLKTCQGKIRLNVIGAGPTGVEYAFAAQQIIQAVDKKTKPMINLFDTGSVLLPMWHPGIVKYVLKRLKKKHITLHSNCRVEAISDNAVQANHQRFASDLTILTIGVIPNTSMVDQQYLDEKGFVRVEETLQVKNQSHVFALGDIVSFDRLVIPKLAQTAANQARFAVHNIMLAEGRSRRAKKYHLLLKGRILTIGAGFSVTEIKGLVIKGRLANLIRCGAYIWKMPGLKHKFNLARSWVSHTFFATNLKTNKLIDNHMNISHIAKHSNLILRFGVSIIFLYFGTMAVLNPEIEAAKWIRPEIFNIINSIIPIAIFMVSFGIFQIAVGLGVVFKILYPWALLAAAGLLVGIIINLGFNDISLRDFVILTAVIHLYLSTKKSL